MYFFFNMKFSLYYILYNLSSLMITLENFLELLPLTSPQFISICILSPIQESTGVAPESLHPHQIRPNAVSNIQRTDSPFFFFFPSRFARFELKPADSLQLGLILPKTSKTVQFRPPKKVDTAWFWLIQPSSGRFGHQN